MGSPKAALEWHGSTLLRRVTGIVGRVVSGPVVVVRAPGQELPPLAAGVEVVEDEREGRGPLQGLAAGLAALDGRFEAAYVSSTDVPLRAPAFVHAVRGRARRRGGRRAARWCTATRSRCRPRIASRCCRSWRSCWRRTGSAPRSCSSAAGCDGSTTRRCSPTAGWRPPTRELASVLNLNEPADVEAARARPTPTVTVERFGARGSPVHARRRWARRRRRRGGAGGARGRGLERRPDRPRSRAAAGGGRHGCAAGLASPGDGPSSGSSPWSSNARKRVEVRVLRAVEVRRAGRSRRARRAVVRAARVCSRVWST